MSDQLEMFETPEQVRSREYNEQLDAYMEARAVAGGFQCQECGGVSPNRSRFWNDHGIMRSRCMAERFARNHTLYDLRNGDRERYINSSARLRAIAAWKATR